MKEFETNWYQAAKDVDLLSQAGIVVGYCVTGKCMMVRFTVPALSTDVTSDVARALARCLARMANVADDKDEPGLIDYH